MRDFSFIAILALAVAANIFAGLGVAASGVPRAQVEASANAILAQLAKPQIVVASDMSAQGSSLQIP